MNSFIIDFFSLVIHFCLTLNSFLLNKLHHLLNPLLKKYKTKDKYINELLYE